MLGIACVTVSPGFPHETRMRTVTYNASKFEAQVEQFWIFAIYRYCRKMNTEKFLGYERILANTEMFLLDKLLPRRFAVRQCRAERSRAPPARFVSAPIRYAPINRSNGTIFRITTALRAALCRKFSAQLSIEFERS